MPGGGATRHHCQRAMQAGDCNTDEPTTIDEQRRRTGLADVGDAERVVVGGSASLERTDASSAVRGAARVVAAQQERSAHKLRPALVGRRRRHIGAHADDIVDVKPLSRTHARTHAPQRSVGIFASQHDVAQRNAGAFLCVVCQRRERERDLRTPARRRCGAPTRDSARRGRRRRPVEALHSQQPIATASHTHAAVSDAEPGKGERAAAVVARYGRRHCQANRARATTHRRGAALRAHRRARSAARRGAQVRAAPTANDAL